MALALGNGLPPVMAQHCFQPAEHEAYENALRESHSQMADNRRHLAELVAPHSGRLMAGTTLEVTTSPPTSTAFRRNAH